MPQANAPGWKGRWLCQMKSKGWPVRFISQKWWCEIISSEIRALSPTTQREGVIFTDDLDEIEKPLGLTDSLLQSCCVQVDNLTFQQKINSPRDHSQPAFPWFLPHQLLPVEQNYPLSLSQCWSTQEPLYYTNLNFCCLSLSPPPASSKCWWIQDLCYVWKDTSG